MASEFCNRPSVNETQQILFALPPLPALDQLAQLIAKKANEIKNLLMGQIDDLILSLKKNEECPSSEETARLIAIRNNLVDSLNRKFSFIERFSSAVSGGNNLLQILIGVIKLTSGIKNGIIIGGAAVPFPIPSAVNSGVEAAQDAIESVKFEVDGSQKLVPISNGLLSVTVAIQVFNNVLANLICQLETLDAAIEECSTDVSNKPTLTPVSEDMLVYIEQVQSNEEQSINDTTYKGFIFEIEEVPFSSTVTRRRANALNSDGIVLLQTELSFTLDPSVLIEELKLVIDQDNLRAD